MPYKEDNFDHPEKGVYYHPLNEDLNLFYHTIRKEFMVQYTIKTVTMNSPPWPHNQPLHPDPVRCNHPRTWNKHSREAQKIQQITGQKGYELHYETHIRPAITGILDQIRRTRQHLIQTEINQQAYEDSLIRIDDWKNCPDCDCPDKCYQHGQCGTGCTNPQRQCQNNKMEGTIL